MNSLIDTTPATDLAHRSWAYVTLGDGHSASWWRDFCVALRSIGYDDVLSIEHEDLSRRPEEGVRMSVEVLQSAVAALH